MGEVRLPKKEFIIIKKFSLSNNENFHNVLEVEPRASPISSPLSL